jgi:protein-tyrosine-phosphatase
LDNQSLNHKMANILVVCTANICRSPVAEALLKDRLHDRGHDDWRVSSAGTWARIKRGASHNSQVVAAQYGFDISNHLARMVEESLLGEADLVLCMEEGHVEALKIEFPDEAYKIYPITAMAGPTYSVEDPFGSSLLDYQRMAAELASIIDRGLDRIIELAETNSSLEN